MTENICIIHSPCDHLKFEIISKCDYPLSNQWSGVTLLVTLSSVSNNFQSHKFSVSNISIIPCLHTYSVGEYKSYTFSILIATYFHNFPYSNTFRVIHPKPNDVYHLEAMTKLSPQIIRDMVIELHHLQIIPPNVNNIIV